MSSNQPLRTNFPVARELESLLAPVSVREFIDDYADRRALLIKGHADKFAFLDFDVDEFFATADRFGMQKDRLRIGLKIPGQYERFQDILPFQARKFYESGETVCITGVSDQHTALGAFAEGIRLALSIPDLRFNSYLSPYGKGFDVHYDNSPVFLLQVGGSKKWWYGAQPIAPQPRVPSRDVSSKPDLATLEHCLLETGDMLYLPGFTWHKAEATDFSLGITLSVRGIHDNLQTAVMHKSPFSVDYPLNRPQPPLHPADVPATEVPATVKPFLEEQLQAMQDYVATLTTENLWQAWQEEVRTAKGPAPMPRNANVQRDSVLRMVRRFPSRLSVSKNEQGGEMLILQHAGHEATFAKPAENFLKWVLAETNEFTAGDAAQHAGETRLGWNEVGQALNLLVSIHVLDEVKR